MICIQTASIEILVAGLLFASGCGKVGGTPDRVSRIEKDLGVILVPPGGINVQDVIEIPNPHETAPLDLKITGKSCSCVSASFIQSRVAPGATGSLQFATHFDGDEGKNGLQINCGSTDPACDIIVRISYEVLPRIEILNWPKSIPVSKEHFEFEAIAVVRTPLNENATDLTVAGPSAATWEVNMQSEVATQDYTERRYSCHISIEGHHNVVEREPMHVTFAGGDHALKQAIAFSPSREYRISPRRPIVRFAEDSVGEVQIVIESDEPFLVVAVEGVDATWKQGQTNLSHAIDLKVQPIERPAKQISVRVTLQKGANRLEVPLKLLAMRGSL